MGLLDGTLQQKIRRLENLTSPKQTGAGSPANKKAIDELRRNIRMSADASKATPKKKKPTAKKGPVKKKSPLSSLRKKKRTV
tara:strand:+ start:564 stop:809 length:246 start_codon:yes stop_codon:yes gene_type:complete